MKIAIPGDLLAHKSLTGVERYTYHLVHSLASSNRIKLTLFSHSDIPVDRLPQKADYQKSGTKKFFGQTHFFSGIQNPKPLLHNDVIHCPTVIAPLFILPNNKIKKVMTVHDLVPALFPELSNLKKYIYYKYALKIIFTYIDHFIVPSKAVQSDLVNLYNINPERVSVIHEGVSGKFHRRSMKKQDYILAVGTVEPRKNFKRIIDAYIHLKSKHRISEKLYIVGKRGWSCNKIYDIPENFKQSIIFKGYVPESDLIDLYQNAKLFIYPSLYEGFGLPVAEAMACGCPVVTSNISSLPEVAGSAAILIDPHNVNDIKSAMLRIIEDEQFASSLVEKGLNQSKQFNWAKCAQETINVYEALLNR